MYCRAGHWSDKDKERILAIPPTRGTESANRVEDRSNGTQSLEDHRSNHKKGAATPSIWIKARRVDFLYRMILIRMLD